MNICKLTIKNSWFVKKKFYIEKYIYIFKMKIIIKICTLTIGNSWFVKKKHSEKYIYFTLIIIIKMCTLTITTTNNSRCLKKKKNRFKTLMVTLLHIIYQSNKLLNGEHISLPLTCVFCRPRAPRGQPLRHRDRVLRCPMGQQGGQQLQRHSQKNSPVVSARDIPDLVSGL